MNQLKFYILHLLSLITVVAFFGSGVVLAENIDPADDESQYAWGENVGWLNAEPLGDGGPGVEVEHANLTGYIWAENIGWISFSCESTGTCGTVDYGVTIDPATGEFSGHAWGENIGWITFRFTGLVPFGVTTSWIASMNDCEGDFDGDDDVDGSDLSVFATDFGRTDCDQADPCNGDFNGDGDVDGSDLAVFAADFGRTNCP